MPTKYARKNEMIKWLDENNVQHNISMRKAELFDLISNNMPKTTTYKIDSLIKNEGHDVVRLPPYHCDLNAIEYVWASVKLYIKERNVTGDLSLQNLQSLLKDALSKVDKDEWAEHCKHVEEIEDDYWKKDGLIEELVDDCVIEVASSDSDSDADDEWSYSESNSDSE